MITIIRFTAPWCMPCKMVAKFFDVFIEQFPDVQFITHDMSVPKEANDVFDRFSINDITMIPTVVAIKDGKEVSRYVGASKKADYEHFIQGVLDE
jgi:thioredoxin 1